MKTLYDTSKELYFENHIPVEKVCNGLCITELLDILDNLNAALDNAEVYNCSLLAMALYDDVTYVKRYILIEIIKTYSSGYVANIIDCTKYAQIDKAINKTLLYLYKTDETNIFPLQIDNTSIANLIKECYSGELTI